MSCQLIFSYRDSRTSYQERTLSHFQGLVMISSTMLPERVYPKICHVFCTGSWYPNRKESGKLHSKVILRQFRCLCDSCPARESGQVGISRTSSLSSRLEGLFPERYGLVIIHSSDTGASLFVQLLKVRHFRLPNTTMFLAVKGRETSHESPPHRSRIRVNSSIVTLIMRLHTYPVNPLWSKAFV